MTSSTHAKHTGPPGATLALGGKAWAHPSLESQLVAAVDLIPYPGNPRRGDQDAITASLRELGLYRALIVQRSTKRILAGNHTYRGLLDLGAEQVPVTWVDVDDDRARAIVARDNRTSDLGEYDDEALLALLLEAGDELALLGYDDADLQALRDVVEGGDDVGDYTRKIDALRYEPTGEQPAADELVDKSKTSELISEIADADLPPDVEKFLIAGAQRHLVFDYQRIAEFYAHADEKVQALMERSALVIIDFDDAISNGFVILADALSEIAALDAADPEAADDDA